MYTRPLPLPFFSQAGVDTITTYLALVAGVYIFQKYLINENWRTTKVVGPGPRT